MAILFLPEQLLASQSTGGYLYGWEEKHVVLVAGVLRDPEYSAATRRLEAARGAIDSDLKIVGQLRHQANESQAHDMRDPKLLYIDMRGRRPPRLVVNLAGRLDIHPQIVLYMVPGKLEVLSLQPISLTPAQASTTAPSKLAKHHGHISQIPDTSDDVEEQELDRALNWACSIARLHYILERAEHDPSRQINAVPHVARYVDRGIPFAPPSTSLFSKPLGAVGRVAELLLVNIVTLLSFRLPVLGSLRDRSAAARQISTRLELLGSTAAHLSEYRRLGATLPIKTSTKLEASASYSRFWNTVWLVANDLIVGYGLSTFVWENTEDLSKIVGTLVQFYVSDYLSDLLEWLNNWPSGVKLNSEVSSLIYDAFKFQSRLWQAFVLEPCLPHFPLLLRLIAICGYFGGASLLLALSSDLVGLLTAPFFACYVSATLVYRWSLVGLSALFNVFRGKKYNPLRARTEPSTYSVDALLLGTILFVMLIFLFPTIAAFYLAFASSRLTIVSIQALAEGIVQGLNVFPLFAIMLRMRYQKRARLPGTVVLQSCSDTRHLDRRHLHLENRPLPYSSILADLVDLPKTYFSATIILQLLSNLGAGKVIFASQLR
ncbi:phosphatidylinositol N-acetylglucosaminyltransferase [Sporobolomyces koalae]|uniref:phosphatidylinositol N-acetylglucosaminyltransferase n=1 Tax=Sporobolomyces koalae TaxID=500713 RepID=UPI003182B3FF